MIIYYEQFVTDCFWKTNDFSYKSYW